MTIVPRDRGTPPHSWRGPHSVATTAVAGTRGAGAGAGAGAGGGASGGARPEETVAVPYSSPANKLRAPAPALEGRSTHVGEYKGGVKTSREAGGEKYKGERERKAEETDRSNLARFSVMGEGRQRLPMGSFHLLSIFLFNLTVSPAWLSIKQPPTWSR